MADIAEIAKWGPVTDAKVTGLYADTGYCCPLCNKDAGDRPIRVNFEKKGMTDFHFHRACAEQLTNSDGNRFATFP
tara:strand:- start:2137 stop:2364 length:228 start_codon:yes stop_codon:yes gene_type:complete